MYVLLAILIVALALFLYAKIKIRNFSRQVFHTDNILEGFKQQEMEYQDTPKSISGMTKIMLPKINDDFPEFNWQDWKRKIETSIISYLEAIEHQDITILKYASEDLKHQLELMIQNDRENHKTKRYTDTKIHKTEIKDYTKNDEQCVITVTSSLQYFLNDNKIQDRFTVELVYRQDPDLISGKSHALTCPHCGAPVTNLGQKKCEYCENILIPVNIKVWEINAMYH